MQSFPCRRFSQYASRFTACGYRPLIPMIAIPSALSLLLVVFCTAAGREGPNRLFEVDFGWAEGNAGADVIAAVLFEVISNKVVSCLPWCATKYLLNSAIVRYSK